MGKISIAGVLRLRAPRSAQDDGFVGVSTKTFRTSSLLL
jgi:hypothetical protein